MGGKIRADERQAGEQGKVPQKITTEVVMYVASVLVAWVFFAFLCAHIGRRKGVGLGAAILGSFPAWFVLFAFWLASHTDKDVLERMKRLEERR